MMTACDYAKFTIDNLQRATLSNALNISNKIDTTNGYSFLEYANGLKQYAITLLSSKNDDKYYNIVYIVNNCIDRYTSGVDCNKSYIIDDLIIDMWLTVNGVKL